MMVSEKRKLMLKRHEKTVMIDIGGLGRMTGDQIIKNINVHKGR